MTGTFARTTEERPAREESDRWLVLAVLTAVYAMNIADRFVISTLIEPIKTEMQLSDGAIGLLTGAALAIFYVSAGIPLGILADRANRKRMIAISLTAWSLLTSVCGMAQNFTQLLLARMGVGIGEAGGTPPSQSILADKFAPRKRAFAMSLYAVGASLGAALGASLGGHLNDLYGWRTTLIIFGLMGLPIALLTLVFVREPKRGLLDHDEPQSSASHSASLRDTLVFIAGQRSLLHVLAGATLVTLWGGGLVWWTPTYLLRAFDMSLGKSGELLGLMHGIVGGGLMLLTAWAMLRLANRPFRQQTWFVAILTLITTIPSILAYTTRSPEFSIMMMWLFVPTIYLYIGPTLALAQNLVPANMRSQTCAIILFLANLANLALAPMLMGLMSDLIAVHAPGPGESLRYVMIGCALTGLWAAVHYICAARGLDQDIRRAGTR